MSSTPVVYLFFFFKQKTAYELRISDWSSDVCSSDLSTNPASRESLMRALGWWSQPSLRPLERRAAARRPSDLRQAAVHRELAGGHEAAVIRREKGRPRRDFRRFGHALQRIHRGEHLQALLAHLGLRQFGRRRPGRQHVDPDAGALDRKSTSQN